MAFFQREKVRVVAARAHADRAVQATVLGVTHASPGLVGVPQERKLEVVLRSSRFVASPVVVVMMIGKGIKRNYQSR